MTAGTGLVTAVLLGPGRRPGSRASLSGGINAWHTSVMATIPRMPVSPVTGRRRRCPAVMILAASVMLVVVGMAGRVVITAPTQTSLASFPSAMAWVMFVSVMMPAG